MPLRFFHLVVIATVLCIHLLLLHPLWLAPALPEIPSLVAPTSIAVSIQVAQARTPPQPKAVIEAPIKKPLKRLAENPAPLHAATEMATETAVVVDDVTTVDQHVQREAPDSPAVEPVAATVTHYEADYGSNPAPPYPPLSKTYREQGVVELRLFVTPEGRVADSEIWHSSGYARLDQAALKAVKQWRFIYRGEGPGTAEWLVVPLRFSLNKDAP